MRRTVLVVACLCLLATPAWAGGGFHLFGTYGQINQWTETSGLGARLSAGGEKVIVDVPSKIYRLSRGNLRRMEKENPQAAGNMHQLVVHLLSERVAHLVKTVNSLER